MGRFSPFVVPQFFGPPLAFALGDELQRMWRDRSFDERHHLDMDAYRAKLREEYGREDDVAFQPPKHVETNDRVKDPPGLPPAKVDPAGQKSIQDPYWKMGPRTLGAPNHYRQGINSIQPRIDMPIYGVPDPKTGLAAKIGNVSRYGAARPSREGQTGPLEHLVMPEMGGQGAAEEPARAPAPALAGQEQQVTPPPLHMPGSEPDWFTPMPEGAAKAAIPGDLNQLVLPPMPGMAPQVTNQGAMMAPPPPPMKPRTEPITPGGGGGYRPMPPALSEATEGAQDPLPKGWKPPLPVKRLGDWMPPLPGTLPKGFSPQVQGTVLMYDGYPVIVGADGRIYDEDGTPFTVSDGQLTVDPADVAATMARSSGRTVGDVMGGTYRNDPAYGGTPALPAPGTGALVAGQKAAPQDTVPRRPAQGQPPLLGTPVQPSQTPQQPVQKERTAPGVPVRKEPPMAMPPAPPPQAAPKLPYKAAEVPPPEMYMGRVNWTGNPATPTAYFDESKSRAYKDRVEQANRVNRLVGAGYGAMESEAAAAGEYDAAARIIVGRGGSAEDWEARLRYQLGVQGGTEADLIRIRNEAVLADARMGAASAVEVANLRGQWDLEIEKWRAENADLIGPLTSEDLQRAGRLAGISYATALLDGMAAPGVLPTLARSMPRGLSAFKSWINTEEGRKYEATISAWSGLLYGKSGAQINEQEWERLSQILPLAGDKGTDLAYKRALRRRELDGVKLQAARGLRTLPPQLRGEIDRLTGLGRSSSTSAVERAEELHAGAHSAAAWSQGLLLKPPYTDEQVRDILRAEGY